ncbi:elongation factor G 2 [Candidatus Photodesmus katoptron]|uniref:Elongation factor G n=1 Tax=Candidatus Photodesmus katoptron Akat1 TaxID=1236703 RepID=S3EHZ9_9GAMM|nr:elongation factor G [Candidatus Photodesmus katoptron]EPE37783.1 translation elongation factor G [Candidatus Photodesmus katoptron Akat1]KEY90496.1 elongation factor G 2 [Candidatus Photodesmus katoptron]
MADLSKYRNIGIFAHVDAGKTTTTERILKLTGQIHKTGEVHDGESTTDFMEQEAERGITIQSAAVSCFWNNHRLNIIDTPGHVDFTVEVYRSLKVLDGGIGVFCGSGGVEPQSETNWRYANESNVARLIFINKLDRIGANFFNVVKQIKSLLGANPLVMTVPIGQENQFIGVVDILNLKAYVWDETDFPENYEIQDIPSDMLESITIYRKELIETAVEQDDYLMESYMEGEEISIENIKTCIRKGTKNLEFFPTFCGSAFKNKGMQLILDAIVDYLPSPTEVNPQPLINPETGKPTGEMATVSEDNPFRALAFKIMDDRFGSLTFIRIYSGCLNKGDTILNSTTNKTERVGRMVEMQANERNELTNAQAGDIIAIVGMKNVQTGHTLCDVKNKCTLEPMIFPSPVISIAVSPKNKGGSEKMAVALNKMIAEDPSFQVETDNETGETILKGMGELHLDIKIDILKRTYNVELNVGAPQVAYRETITQTVEDSYTHKKQSGGAGQFAKIDYRIKPGKLNSGFIFSSKVVGGNVPKEFLPAVEKGFLSMMNNGILAGFPILDIEIELFDGAFHSVDSSTIAFEIASKNAFRQSMPKTDPKLLEPIMYVDVFTPGDHIGDVIGDLNRRRGIIKDQQSTATGVRIKANVPLSEMFGYIGHLRTMTSGRGQFSMEFNHYTKCPDKIAEDIIATKKEKNSKK